MELRVNPEKGDVIPGGGGARKIRMAIGITGKSGGARVIYYARVSVSLIFLLNIYGKEEKSDLTPKERKAIAKAISGIKENVNEKSKGKG